MHFSNLTRHMGTDNLESSFRSYCCIQYLLSTMNILISLCIDYILNFTSPLTIFSFLGRNYAPCIEVHNNFLAYKLQ